jgi:hypothetical protein
MGARFSTPVQARPGAHPGTESFSGQDGWGCALITHHHIPARLKKEGYTSRPPSRAFMICSAVNFTVTFTFTEIITVNMTLGNQFISVFFVATLLLFVSCLIRLYKADLENHTLKSHNSCYSSSAI